jgi:hypothetical protein
MIPSRRRRLTLLAVPNISDHGRVRASIPSSGCVEHALIRRPTPRFAAPVGAAILGAERTVNGHLSVLPTEVRLPFRRTKSVPDLAKPQRFPVASIDLSRADVGLPYGVPRKVNAATLKKIAGGRRSDRLLKKTPLGWEFVADDVMIDLSDSSVEFKLGRLTIFS